MASSAHAISPIAARTPKQTSQIRVTTITPCQGVWRRPAYPPHPVERRHYFRGCSVRVHLDALHRRRVDEAPDTDRLVDLGRKHHHAFLQHEADAADVADALGRVAV